MKPDRLVPIVAATLAVLALGVGAAAIDSPTSPGNGPGFGGGSSGGIGGGSSFDLGQSSPTNGGLTISSLTFQVAVVLLVVAFLASLYVLRDEIGLRHLKLVAVLAVILGVVLAVVYFLLHLSSGPSGSNATSGALGQTRRSFPGGGSDGAVDTVTRSFSPGPVVALVILAVLVVAVVAVLRRGNDGDDTQPAVEPTDSAGLAEIGRAAGRAADRIAADESTENEVYRAWREMADHVDVPNPHASTPGEFARAATDAGMTREDVAELTDLFSTVRYGGGAVTAERESRAVAALRRIEDAYAEES